jgi:hypothetical protein
MNLNKLQIARDIFPVTQQYAGKITETVLPEWIQGDLEQKVVWRTGNGPFNKDDLDELLIKLGGLEATESMDWNEVDLVVVGREDFDDWSLEQSLVEKSDLWYLSQEDFLNWVLFGIKTHYTENDRRILQHPGLFVLSKVKFNWPDTFVMPGDGEIDVEGWAQEHVLKYKYGYEVDARSGLSDTARRTKLKNAIGELRLKNIVYHLAMLVRTRKGRSDNIMENAIGKWKSDLGWIKMTYYDNTAYEFPWPFY